MKRELIPSDTSLILPTLPPGARILVIRLRSLGDAVLLTPAATALHSWRPDLRISVLLEPAYTPLLENNPALCEVLPMRGFFATAKMLRQRRFAVVFNQHSGPASALLTAVSGAPLRVCWVCRQFSRVYNVRVPSPRAFFGRDAVHSVEQRMTQFYWTGLPQSPIPPACVFPRADEVAGMREKLAALGLAPGRPFVLLRPGAPHAAKRWPLEQFMALGKWLAGERGLVPVFNAAPEEQSLEARIKQEMPPEGILSGGLSLREFIALCAEAQLFIGNDTGPTHVAAAAGRPVVAIFGASNAVHWHPWGVPHRVVKGSVNAERRGIEAPLIEVQRACDELLAEIPALRERVAQPGAEERTLGARN